MPKTQNCLIFDTAEGSGAALCRALCLFLILIVSPSFAAELGDKARGLAYAKKACAHCHAIDARRASSPLPNAPTFIEIANAPEMTEAAMVERLLTSHPKMPGLIKPGQKTDDLIAYLATLRKE